MTRSRAAAGMVLLVGAFWFSAGPGGACLRAVLACRHHAAEHAHSPAAPPAPAQGPCFCAEMTGGFDVALSVALPAPAEVPVVATAPEWLRDDTPRFPLPASPFLGLVSPPPNLLA